LRKQFNQREQLQLQQQLQLADAQLAGLNRAISQIEARRSRLLLEKDNLPLPERDRIGKMPTSLKESCLALAEDHEFLLRGGVFNKEIIDVWIETKMRREYDEVRNRPHPYEMSLYFDC